MYGLSSQTELGFLIGQRVIQVCFGSNDLILKLDGSQSVTITVTSSIRCSSPTNAGLQSETFKNYAVFLLALIETIVEAVNIHESGTLELRFAGGSSLFIYDDSDQFESYTIEHEGRLIVV